MTDNNFQIKAFDHTPGTIINTDEYEIACTKLDHDTPSLGYSFEVKESSRLDKEKLKKLKIPNSPLIGKLVKGETIEVNGKKIDGKKLIYKEKKRKITLISDTRYNKEIAKFAKDSDLLISESTYSKEESEVATKYGHLTSNQAATIAKNSKSKKLALIHLSQRYEQIPRIIKKEAKEVFSETIIPEDLDKIVL